MNSGEPYVADGAKRKRRRDAFSGILTSNANIEAIALISREGYRIAFSALPQYQVDGDQFCGLASALLMTGSSTIKTLFQEDICEIIVRAENSYIIISAAGRVFLVGASRKVEDLEKIVSVFRYYSKNFEEKLQKKWKKE